jgi:purine-binding chemotaxis protein CheW
MLAAKETAAAARADARAGRYLIFQLGHEEFGIRAPKVREIMGLQELTAVSRAPAQVKGVIHPRGQVGPVIDLRLTFGMPAAEYGRGACIIVTQAQGETGPALMGIVVDGVSEVLDLTAGEIGEIDGAPDFGEKAARHYLLGMAKVKGKVKILLDIDKALTSQDLHNLNMVLNR